MACFVSDSDDSLSKRELPNYAKWEHKARFSNSMGQLSLASAQAWSKFCQHLTPVQTKAKDATILLTECLSSAVRRALRAAQQRNMPRNERNRRRPWKAAQHPCTAHILPDPLKAKCNQNRYACNSS